MRPPFWFIGLCRVVWYLVLAPISLLHLLLTLLGGGKEPAWLDQAPALILPWLGAGAVWCIVVMRLAGVISAP